MPLLSDLAKYFSMRWARLRLLLGKSASKTVEVRPFSAVVQPRASRQYLQHLANEAQWRRAHQYVTKHDGRSEQAPVGAHRRLASPSDADPIPTPFRYRTRSAQEVVPAGSVTGSVGAAGVVSLEQALLSGMVLQAGRGFDQGQEAVRDRSLGGSLGPDGAMGGALAHRDCALDASPSWSSGADDDTHSRRSTSSWSGSGSHHNQDTRDDTSDRSSSDSGSGSSPSYGD